MHHDRVVEAATQAADAIKGAPPATVGVLTLAGVPIEHWIQVASLVWILCLLSAWFYTVGRAAWAWHKARTHTKRRNARR
jgi:1,4-dihydroxy-2-naphthoate octaprenyltransferase